MSFTLWSLLVNILVPPCIFLLTLVSIPLPNKINHYVYKLVNLIFSFLLTPIEVRNRKITVYSFLTGVAFLIFVSQSWALYTHEPPQQEEHSSNQNSQHYFKNDFYLKCKRWRIERNFWISFFNFVVYWLLYRIICLRNRLEEKEHDE